MKIGFFDIKSKKEMKIIQNRFRKNNINLIFYKETINNVKKEEIKDLDIISIFTSSKINKEIFRLMSNLKLILTRSTGTDHIDKSFAKKNNVQIINISNYSPETIAEHTLALLLNISKQLYSTINLVKKGDYQLYGQTTFNLKEKKIGIIGFGNIGQAFAKICSALNMQVIVFDEYITPEKKDFAKQNNIKLGRDFNEILKKSDIISLHLPLTKKTKYLIDEGNIKIMKKGVIILNTSRGGLLDIKAITKAIQQKHIAFLGLDVLEHEELMDKDIDLNNKKFNKKDLEIVILNKNLLFNENVFVTPHSAFNTTYAKKQILEKTIFLLKEYLEKSQN